MTTTMIVDDEEDMRVLLRATIAVANNGLSVACEASDGVEAVTVWRGCRPDVVILDQRMPMMTGLEAAKRILSEEPSQQIILFSAFLTAALRQQAAALGVRDCISKDRLADIPRALWSASSN